MSLYFDGLPSELLSLLFLKFSKNDLFALLSKIKPLNIYCQLLKDKHFWKTVWNRDISSFVQAPVNIQELYLDIINNNKKFEEDELDYLTSSGYDILLYEQLLSNKDNERFKELCDHVFVTAACSDHKSIVCKMIELGADEFMMALINIASTDNVEMVKFLISKSNRRVDFDALLDMASYCGELNMATYLAENGATDYNWGMHNAVFMNHIDIVKLLLEKGATNHDGCILLADEKKHDCIVELIKRFRDNRRSNNL